MNERLLREALTDARAAIDGLRVCRRAGDLQRFEDILVAHAHARDVAETVWVVELEDMRFWYQYDHGALSVWADIALLQNDYVHLFPVRHYTNALPALRAEGTPEDNPRHLVWEHVFDNALHELERQRALDALILAERREMAWTESATEEQLSEYYASLIAGDGNEGEYEHFDMKEIQFWKAWTTDPQKPWNKGG